MARPGTQRAARPRQQDGGNGTARAKGPAFHRPANDNRPPLAVLILRWTLIAGMTAMAAAILWWAVR